MVHLLGLSSFLLFVAVQFQCVTNQAVPPACLDQADAELCDCLTTSSDPLRRCSFGIPDPTEEMPVNLTIGFIGDQGITPGAQDVLQLLLNEKVEAVLHAGDFDYVNSPNAWESQINSVLGADFPYFSAVGNHDLPRWTQYSQLIFNRYQKFGAKCWGDVGRDAVCSFKGLVFAISGVGTTSKFDEVLLAQALDAFPSAFPICMWHKNQANMQLGGKRDETGYEVYNTCNEKGALIITGHEHSYSRTKQMTSYGVAPRYANVPSTPEGGDQLYLSPGRSVALVTGVGGKEIRVCTENKQFNPWWGKAICSNSSPALTEYGALICKFNLNGESNKALCELKLTDGEIMDRFTLISTHSKILNRKPQLIGATAEKAPAPFYGIPTFLTSSMFIFVIVIAAFSAIVGAITAIRGRLIKKKQIVKIPLLSEP